MRITLAVEEAMRLALSLSTSFDGLLLWVTCSTMEMVHFLSATWETFDTSRLINTHLFTTKRNMMVHSCADACKKIIGCRDEARVFRRYNTL
jgi:hypothetical protein